MATTPVLIVMLSTLALITRAAPSSDPQNSEPKAHLDSTWEIALGVVLALLLTGLAVIIVILKIRQRRRRAASRSDMVQTQPPATYSLPYGMSRPPATHSLPYGMSRPQSAIVHDKHSTSRHSDRRSKETA